MSIVTKDNNGVASTGLKNSLSTYLNSRAIRAINDVVEVVGATASTVNVTATITLLKGASTTAFNDLPGILTTAFNAINDIGRDITLSWLIKTLSTSSVYKVQLVSPASDVIVGETGFAKLGTINLTLAPTSGY
jgi:phage-related baseplate assembly protein